MNALRILVVDDNEALRYTIERRLRIEGYHVDGLSDGAAAVDAIEKGNYDILITDIVMDGVDGFELLRRIKDFRKSLKVICISAGGRTTGEDYLRLSRQLQIDRALSKPFTHAQLVEMVEALGRKAAS
ncbi:MAG TPA: response regulator [Phycisphaerales bacterium]|nr:response regulator [Phycisphaerales bacterium]